MKHDELILENQCRTAARLKGWVAAKLEKNGHKGIPDDLFISPDGNKVLLVEFKKDAQQKPRPEQILWKERYPKLVYLISDFDSFLSLIQ